MNGYSVVIGVGIVAAIGYCIWRMSENKKTVASIQEDVIDGTLKMEDVKNYFKSQQLVQGQDIPFMANGDCAEFKKILNRSFPQKKEGYHTLFIGVYNSQKNELRFARIIHARIIDESIVQVLGDEHLVVLS